MNLKKGAVAVAPQTHHRRASTGNQTYMMNQPTPTSGKKSKKENQKLKGEVKAL
jgi:hypothetical protein